MKAPSGRQALRLVAPVTNPSGVKSPDTTRRPLLYISADEAGQVVVIRLARHVVGIRLIIAIDTLVGIEQAVFRRPSLILLDANLGDFNSEKVVLSLRERADLTRMPIIVLGYDDSPGERARFVWAGATDYLPMPLDLGRFERLVLELLGSTGEG